MWSAIAADVHAIWQMLPAATVALQFVSALIGFVVTTWTFVRRIRRWRRRRR